MELVIVPRTQRGFQTGQKWWLMSPSHALIICRRAVDKNVGIYVLHIYRHTYIMISTKLVKGALPMQKRVKNLMARANKNLVGVVEARRADNDLMNYLEYEWLED